MCDIVNDSPGVVINLLMSSVLSIYLKYIFGNATCYASWCDGQWSATVNDNTI